MDSKIEKAQRERAVEIGRSGDIKAFPELVELVASPVANIRRLVVSAISKLAGLVDSDLAVSTVVPLLQGSKPQVRQYAIRALRSYGIASECVLSDLRVIALSSVEKEYNKRDAKLAIEIIEEALRIEEKRAVCLCQRCGVELDEKEFVQSQKAFQSCYCNYCFDEIFLERRNFETKVELQKNIRAKDGTWVQSHGERIICEILDSENIKYRYDERFRILDGYAIRPDFYLPEFDVYIEYWGMDTNDYKIGMLKKQNLYQQQGKKLISVYPKDKSDMTRIILEKLKR